MASDIFPLALAKPGEEVILVSIAGGMGLRRRLIAMGLNEGMKFKVLHVRRFGPCVILVGNLRLILGHGMIHRVMVRKV